MVGVTVKINTRQSSCSSTCRPIAYHFTAMLAFAVLLAATGPAIALHPQSLLADGGDTLIALSILQWIEHCISTLNHNVFNFPIFYPAEQTLFFTEHMLGIGVFFSLAKAITKDPVLAFNLVLLFFFTLNFYFTFLLARQLRVSYVGSFMSGTTFGALPFLLEFTPHIHLAPGFFIPLTFYFINRILADQKPFHILSVAACIGIQFYFGVTLGLILVFSSVIFFFYLSIFDLRQLKKIFLATPRKSFLHLVGAALLATSMLSPLIWGYKSAQTTYGMSRTLIETVPYSIEPSALLAHATSLDAVQQSLNITYVPQHFFEATLIGQVPVYVMIISLLFLVLRRHFPRGKDPWFSGTMLMLGLMFVLTLGPFWLVNGQQTSVPLPFILFFKIFPGFDAMRVPARFIIPLGFFAAMLLGLLWKLATSSLQIAKGASKILAALSLLVLFAAFVSDRFIQYSRSGLHISALSPPPVYQYVRDGSARPILEIPIWPPSPTTFSYFYHQSADWRPRVGGISSYFPPAFIKLRDHLSSCPSDICLDFLSETGAETIIVHLSALEDRVADYWRARTADFGPFRFVGKFGEALLWERSSTSITKVPAPKYNMGETIDFSTNGNSHLYEAGGWSGRESWGRWSTGKEAALKFRIDATSNKPMLLHIRCGAFVNRKHPHQAVAINANGNRVGLLHFGADRGGNTLTEFSVEIPSRFVGNHGEILITLTTADSVSPRSLGLGEDDRALGVAVSSIRLTAKD